MPDPNNELPKPQVARNVARMVERQTEGVNLGRACQSGRCRRDAVCAIERHGTQLLVCARCAGLAATGLLR
jgi:hypothetical protein